MTLHTMHFSQNIISIEWYRTKSPEICVVFADIDECSSDPSPCDENADCTNSDGSYSCTCKQGFAGNGTVCNGMRELSVSLHFFPAKICFYVTIQWNYPETYELIISLNISSDVDECSAESSPCDENADCANSDGFYSCTCKQGFTGNGTVCEGNKGFLFLNQNTQLLPPWVWVFIN